MNTLNKLLGGSEQILLTGTTPWVAPTGIAAFAVTIRVDASRIDTLTERKLKSQAGTANTSYSWEAVDTLLKGETIIFRYPVTGITLHNATDSIWIHCQNYSS